MSVIIKWLGHAAFQIRAGKKIIYIDLAKNAEPVEKADLILVTHSHSDHLDAGIIQSVRKGDTVVIAPSDCAQQIGGKVQSLKSGEEITIHDIRVRATWAYNETRFRAPGQPYHPKGFGVGYLITVEGKRIYHAGDTDFIQEMKQLGPIDVALLPTGGTYTMENDDAADAAMAINPKAVIPHHNWSKSVTGFRDKVEANSNIKVVVLKKGGEYSL